MLIEPIKPVSATSFQDVLVVVTNTADDEAALAAADDLCTQMGGRATALLASPFQPSYVMGDAYDGGAQIWGVIIAELAKGAAKEGAHLRQRLERATAPFEFRTVEDDPLMSRQQVLMSARHADLSIFTRPAGGVDSAGRNDLLEAALFESGRPVLVVPPGHSRPMRFKKIVVAWNASREAARAVGDACGVLQSAEQIVVVTVDAKPTALGLGQAPGEDIAAHLAHHHAKVELRNVDAMGRAEAAAILDVAHSIDADLIVLGAYGHARMREFVFGGVTHELLRRADVPLFLSH